MTFGDVVHCVNCGADIKSLVFPHYCGYCLGILRGTGQLPSGLLEQRRLEDDEI
jgi:hypothetical protein